MQSMIQIELSKQGFTVFRANAGSGWTGKEIIRTANGGVYIPEARVLQAMVKGFSDLFGVAPEGKIFFIEVKTPTGRISPEQTTFLNRMREIGARAGIARSVSDAVAIARGEL